MSLHLKIAQSLPRDSVSLRALLSIASMEETEEVATACVTFGQSPRLLINPKFVAQHANTSVKLQTLISHELLHIALGHTRRYTTCSALDNLVFDCLINSTLAKADPTPERTALFRDFYDKDRFPECFLRPPEDWHPSLRPKLPRALRSAGIDGLPFVQNVYRRLWRDEGVSGSELRAAILLAATSLEVPIGQVIDQIPLLGGHQEHIHEPIATELAEHLAGLVVKEITGKLSKRGIEPNASFPLAANVKPAKPKNAGIRRQLRRLLEQLAFGNGPARLKSDGQHARSCVTPIPQRDRRAIVARLLGMQPMLYASNDMHLKPQSSERIHVYLDVSGSMDSVVPALYGAMHDYKDTIYEKIHIFSTEVADISPKQLKAGLRITTRGTDIDCVADHMQKFKVRRALMITDGVVGKPSPSSEKVFKKTQMVIGLCGSYTIADELSRFAISCEKLDL